MMDAFVINSLKTNPYYNLALEEYLLSMCRIHQKPILYLWQNDNTVVVGKNQNIYTECNMQVLREEGVFLARRITGGGAVYHDLGNLNYTIITPRLHYDIEKNTEIVIKSLKTCGLDAYKNGRNDICTSKGKISGNAYYSDALVGLQHGTVLYRADVAAMERFLSVSEGKLSKRGIKSVRSRISDVVSQSDNIAISDIKESIVKYFLDLYNIGDYKNHINVDKTEFDILNDKYSSKEWIEGKIKEYSVSKKASLSWGEVELHVLLIGESVSRIEVYTDCIDLEFVESIKKEMRRCINKQTHASFPAISFRENALIAHKDWTLEFEDFLRSILLELDLDYVDKRM